MPYIRVIHNALYPNYEEVEHECEDCGTIFIDNNRSTKRCDPCKAVKKKEVNDSQTKRRQSERIKVNKKKQK
jgi:hypothetical protein